MSQKKENIAFICSHCGKKVIALTNGSYRNHCPHCLYSLHVDNMPGDRTNECHGLMIPIDIIWHNKKGYQIIHRCTKCQISRPNRIAQDTLMPDNETLILEMIRQKSK